MLPFSGESLSQARRRTRAAAPVSIRARIRSLQVAHKARCIAERGREHALPQALSQGSEVSSASMACPVSGKGDILRLTVRDPGVSEAQRREEGDANVMCMTVASKGHAGDAHAEGLARRRGACTHAR